MGDDSPGWDHYQIAVASLLLVGFGVGYGLGMDAQGDGTFGLATFILGLAGLLAVWAATYERGESEDAE